MFVDRVTRRQRQTHRGVRAVVTGQVGLDKKPFLEEAAELARASGHEVQLFHVGERMYAEAPDIVSPRILDLPRHRLNTLRRSVFKDVLAAARTGANLIVNTHATFRWKHGLFHAFDHAQMVELDADLYVTLVDNVDAVHERLLREHELRHTLQDILVWREEEIVVTELMAESIAGYGRAFVISRGQSRIAAQSLFRLMFEPNRRRVYPSFPMTHVLDQPLILAEIERFRDALSEHFITFDPADLDEKRLLHEAEQSRLRGGDTITITTQGRFVTLDLGEVTRMARDIDAQIYARDFKLIDQSDMIVSYVPALPDGRPAISSGVERELHHAFEGTKEAHVIWTARCDPSPFVTETATAIHPSIEAAFEDFRRRGYLGHDRLHRPTRASASSSGG